MDFILFFSIFSVSLLWAKLPQRCINGCFDKHETVPHFLWFPSSSSARARLLGLPLWQLGSPWRLVSAFLHTDFLAEASKSGDGPLRCGAATVTLWHKMVSCHAVFTHLPTVNTHGVKPCWDCDRHGQHRSGSILDEVAHPQTCGKTKALFLLFE